MTALFATVFFASLLGSVHCAGMCGGFIAFYAGSDATGGRARWFGHLAYSGGRLLTYSILGVFAGWLGRAVDLAGSFAGVGRIAAVLAGLSMVAWGSVGVLRALGLSLPRLPLPARLERLYGRSLQTMRGRPPVVRAAILGLACVALFERHLTWLQLRLQAVPRRVCRIVAINLQHVLGIIWIARKRWRPA